MASSYQEISDLTGQMVANGEMSPDEQLQVHKALSQKGYGPGAPAPPLPGALASPKEREGLPSMVGLDIGAATQPIWDFAKAGYDRMTGGAAHMAQPGLEPKLQGASDVLRGGAQMVAPSALPLAAAASPVGLLVGAGTGAVGSGVAGALGRNAKLSPGAQSLLEDVGGIAGGALGGRYAQPAVDGLLTAVGKGTRNLVGMTTGRGATGVAAAQSNDPQFMEAMRGGVTEPQLAAKVSSARDALDNQAGNQYKQDYAALPTARLPLAARVPTKIEDGINSILDKFKVTGDADGNLDFSRSHIPDAASQNDIKGIVAIVRNWGSNPDDYTPQGLDILKKQLQNKISETGPGSSATTQMKAVVQNILEDNVPGYKEMTAKYARAQELIRNVEDEFSLEARNPGTAIRKVMGAQNQPNGNNYRVDLLKKLDAAAGTNVTPSAQGMGFRDWMPSGLNAKIATGDLGAVGALGATGHPLAAVGLLSGAALTSPRLMGETAAALGRVPKLPYRAPWRTGAVGGLLSLPGNQ